MNIHLNEHSRASVPKEETWLFVWLLFDIHSSVDAATTAVDLGFIPFYKSK